MDKRATGGCFPFPQSVRKGNGKRLLHCGPAMRCAGDATGGFKSAEGGRERLVTHAQSCPQGAMGGGACAAQVSDDALSESDGGRWRRRCIIRVVELGEFGVVLQLETNQRGLASAGVIGGQQLERGVGGVAARCSTDWFCAAATSNSTNSTAVVNSTR